MAEFCHGTTHLDPIGFLVVPRVATDPPGPNCLERHFAYVEGRKPLIDESCWDGFASWAPE
jgi:hypothetical protein